jgi:hypothetical protein
MRNFFEKKTHDGPLVGRNYANLHQLLLKSIFFEDFEIKVRFNPKCIRSSDTDTDDLSASGLCFFYRVDPFPNGFER